jgi:hypothetical protein
MRVYLCFLERSKNYYHFNIGYFSDSVPYSISRVLWDHRQSKSESVFNILPLVHCVPTIITSSMFIGFERMSNDWKVEEVNYKFGITSFLR